jgi:hypothetical protein
MKQKEQELKFTKVMQALIDLRCWLTVVEIVHTPSTGTKIQLATCYNKVVEALNRVKEK